LIGPSTYESLRRRNDKFGVPLVPWQIGGAMPHPSFLRGLATTSLALLVLATLGTGSGCTVHLTDANDDAANAPGSSNADAGQGRADSDVPPGCDASKSPKVDPCVLRDSLGIFVSPTGDDSAKGTREHPYKTFAKAMDAAHAAGKRVYACVGDYPEAITLVDGVDVYGGVNCQAFTSATGTSRLVPTTSPVITVKGTTTGVHLERLEAIAPTGSNPGDSSIAMIATDAKHIALVEVHLSAAAGRNGADGKEGAIGLPGDLAGAGGASIECPADGTGGGAEGSAGTKMALGGKGGAALCGSLTTFRDGASAPLVADSCGHGGLFDGVSTCTGGQNGCGGASGASGTGGAAMGTLASTGYVASNTGVDGATGKDGGGGGGGAAGNSALAFGKRRSGGGGGGGGGSGGGGSGAKGGGGGGASIALVSISSDVMLAGSTLDTANGGNGGNGGAGGLGGKGGGGGKGGESLSTADGTGCAGGDGGTGGKGGDGGGGGGGPSLGIAFKGTAPNADPATTITIGVAGLGGSRDIAARAGAPGVATKTKEL
jgi:hypothetical protein